MRQIGIALDAFLVPMTSARGLRLAMLLLLAFCGLVALALLFGSRSSLARIRELAIVPGISLAAVLLSEMPLRDGIRQRTLLYPLLGPVSRANLAAVRTLATALLLAVVASIVVLVLRVLEGGGSGSVGRDLLAVWFGAAAYTSLFGIIQLLTRRGLITSLAICWIFDYPLGRFPVALRNLAPSFHLRVLADQETSISLPVSLTPPPSSLPLSMVVLFLVTVASVALIAFLFSRKNLGELC